MARVWPSSTSGIPSNPIQDVDVHLPPIEVQDRLVSIYMTYIHPTFPVLHKTSFLSDYHARSASRLTFLPRRLTMNLLGNSTSRTVVFHRVLPSLTFIRSSVGSPVGESSSSQTSPKPEPCQEITPLLLLSIFAIASRFDDEHVAHSNGRLSEAGSGYVEDARRILRELSYSPTGLCHNHRQTPSDTRGCL
jgi:Fungal specific transcription factor domain